MNKYLLGAIALFILSFFMPVMSDQFDPEQSIYGWEIVVNIFNPSEEGMFSQDGLQVFGYVLAALPNLLVLTIIILKLTADKQKMVWTFGTIAVVAAIIWLPFFFSVLMTDFKSGYWMWLIAIFLIHYYANDGSFKRQKRKAPLTLEEE